VVDPLVWPDGSGDPIDLGRRMGVIAEHYPHLDIWGGCCGTWDTHLDHIARNVKAH
jgi:methionine synthase I (cobalamin-dependent)